MQTSVSQILAKTGATVGSRFGGLLGIWGIYFVAQIALVVVLGLVIGASVFGAIAGAGAAGLDGPGAGMGLGVGMILMIVLAYLAILLIAVAQSSSLIAFASPLQKLSLGDALNAGMRSALPMLGVMVLLLIVYFVGALILGLVMGVIGSISTTLAGLVGIFLIPVGIYLMCRICTINAVVAVERVGNPIAAIKRGWAQTSSNVLAILGVMVIFVIALVVVGGLLFMPVISSMMSATMSGAPPSLSGMGLSMVGFFVFSIVMTIVSSALFAVIHAEVSDTSPAKTTDVFS
jgi:hypothetical protein